MNEPDRPRRRLRNRLLVVIIGVTLGVLVITVLGAAAVARQSAESSAVSDLKQNAPTVSSELTTLARRYRQAARNSNTANTTATCLLIRGVLRISGGSVVTVNTDGSVQEGVGNLLGTTACLQAGTLFRLPNDLPDRALDTTKLLAGTTNSGVSGDTAFVATPLAVVDGLLPVLVLTDHVESRPLGQGGGLVIVIGIGALLVAAFVAAWLARRLTRPIAAMQVTAGRIASGDLSARVDLASMPADELGSLAASIDAMADELEQARGHERTFLLSVSHDLRTPLTSIKGYAEAMADGTVEAPADRIRAAEVIASETRRLERLVADLLDLARLDAHQFSLTTRPVDARDVVAATVAGFAPLAEQWNVELSTLTGEALPVDSDPERLAQIVANLVENALKYARYRVVVGVTRVGGWIELQVDDDGPGIPPAEQTRVFDRLYTARGEPGRAVGTGIGLAIVRELAAAMGGDAYCQSLNGQGTRFLVQLPA